MTKRQFLKHVWKYIEFFRALLKHSFGKNCWLTVVIKLLTSSFKPELIFVMLILFHVGGDLTSYKPQL